jgi:hypothetical protein
MPGIGIGIGIGIGNRPPEPNVKFDMLENGLDFITEAIESINTSAKHRMLKYAVIHLSAGVELIFKEALRNVDWRYIFQEIRDAKPELLQSGDFKSVTLNKAIQRLESDCKVKFTDEEKKILDDFRLIRNRIEHFKFDEKVRTLRNLSAKVLNLLIQFINTYIIIDNVSNLSRKYIKNLPVELGKFGSYVSEYNQRIEQNRVIN